MSGRLIAVLVVVGLCVGGGIAWFFLKHRPGQFDVVAKPFPELEPPQFGKDDWPWWRGPTRDNHAVGSGYATEWGEGKNIVWKTPIPGFGLSSPILLGERVFVTTADEKSQRQLVIGFDRTTGRKLWETAAHEKNFPARKHGDNSHASGTPATDGKRVFAVFANASAVHVTALDLDGKKVWQREAGPHGGSGSHGYGGSLAIWGPYVYVSDDSPDGGWLAGLNRETGEVGWRVSRRTGMGSYGTPIIAEFGGKTMLILAGNGYVTAYDPKDGKVLWEQTGLGEVTANTVAFGGDMLFASSGYPKRALLALRPDGSVAWRKESRKPIPYPPTMLYFADSLLVVSDDADIVACYDAATGVERWSERIEGSYFYSSPLFADGKIYLCDRAGHCRVIEASSDGLIQIARNRLDEPIGASPVAARGRLFIRGRDHLYCVGN